MPLTNHLLQDTSATANWQNILSWVHQLQPLYEQVLQSNQQRGLALFGAGFVGLYAQNYLRSPQIPVQCFIDNAPDKQDSELEGLPVVGLDHPLAQSAALILVSTLRACQKLMNQLRQSGHNPLTYQAFFIKADILRK